MAKITLKLVVSLARNARTGDTPLRGSRPPTTTQKKCRWL